MSAPSTTDADWAGQQIYRMTDAEGQVHLAETAGTIRAAAFGTEVLCGYERPLGRVRRQGEHSAFPDALVCPVCAREAGP